MDILQTIKIEIVCKSMLSRIAPQDLMVGQFWTACPELPHLIFILTYKVFLKHFEFYFNWNSL